MLLWFLVPILRTKMSSASGGVLTHVAYTTDSKFLLCGSGCVVKLYSTATGAQVRQLEGHTDEITAVAHHPTSVLQAFSASLDGRIVLWDLDEAIILRVICVGQPILSMALDAAMPEAKAIVLTGSSAMPLDVPAYCHGIMHGSRVYSVALRISEDQSAWAASQLARADGAPAATAAAGDAKQHGTFGTLARPWPAAATFLFKARGATALAVGACGGNSSVVGALCGKMLRLHDVAAGVPPPDMRASVVRACDWACHSGGLRVRTASALAEYPRSQSIRARAASTRV